MHEYDFISTNIDETQVKAIISTAGFDPSNYTYSERVGRDGYLVKGAEVMSVTLLENAARKLRIKVEISS
jgi:hypothetical protein